MGQVVCEQGNRLKTCAHFFSCFLFSSICFLLLGFVWGCKVRVHKLMIAWDWILHMYFICEVRWICKYCTLKAMWIRFCVCVLELISHHMCERQELDARPSWAMWTELEMTHHGSCQAVDLHLCNISVGVFLGRDVKVLMLTVAFARIHLIQMYSMSCKADRIRLILFCFLKTKIRWNFQLPTYELQVDSAQTSPSYFAIAY